MKYLLPLLFVALVPSGLFAQDSKEYRACREKAKTQLEMNTCANGEAVRADAELNHIYQDLISRVRDNPGATEKIKTAEVAWISYRDAYMNAMYPAENKLAEYGSIFPMRADLLRAKLTRKQVEGLKDLLQQYSK